MAKPALDLAIKLRDLLQRSDRTPNDSVVLGHISVYIHAEQAKAKAKAKAKGD